MHRISLGWFAELGSHLEPLTNTSKITEITIFHLYKIKEYLGALSDPKVYPLDLRVSRPVVWKLQNQINRVLDAPQPNQQAALDSGRWDIWQSASNLESLLLGELAVQPVYHVWRKRAYDTEALVGEGETIFSKELRDDLNEDELYNIREAGKCLAFEIPTAAAFHLFRCAESIIRRYYELVVGELPKPKMRNWGLYIRNLRKCGADEMVLAFLGQIKDLHRNPVIHPETKLGTEEALSLTAIVDSAMQAIVKDMKKRRENPQLPLPNPTASLSDDLSTEESGQSHAQNQSNSAQHQESAQSQ
jgi:hypothetical protein